MVRIYDEKNQLVVEGSDADKNKVIKAARAVANGRRLVGEEDGPDGRTRGFFVTVAPIALGM